MIYQNLHCIMFQLVGTKWHLSKATIELSYIHGNTELLHFMTKLKTLSNDEISEVLYNFLSGKLPFQTLKTTLEGLIIYKSSNGERSRLEKLENWKLYFSKTPKTTLDGLITLTFHVLQNIGGLQHIDSVKLAMRHVSFDFSYAPEQREIHDIRMDEKLQFPVKAEYLCQMLMKYISTAISDQNLDGYEILNAIVKRNLYQDGF